MAKTILPGTGADHPEEVGSGVHRKSPDPVREEIERHPTASYVAVFGHPLHAMTVHFPIALSFATLGADVFYWYSGDPFWMRAGIWTAGFAFVAGLAAGSFGAMELLFVKGIRIRAASWGHAIAAITLIAILGTNWGVRFSNIEDTLPHGLTLSILGAIFTAIAGWHGGKLVYDHGLGTFISSKKAERI